MLIVTAITASVLTLIYIKLSFSIIGRRRKHQVSLGSGGHADLEQAIRAHGNFAEYAPLALLLLGCLEINGAPWWLVAIPAIGFIVGRLFHAKGIHEPPPHFNNRVRGMKLTFFTLIGLAVLNLLWAVIRIMH